MSVELITNEEQFAVALIQQREQMLATINSAGDIRIVCEMKSQADALKWYGRQHKEYKEAARIASEMAVRCDRRKGELLRQLRESGVLTHGGDRKSESKLQAATLKELGIEKTESSRCQRLASIPEDAFEQQIEQQRGVKDGFCSTAALLRYEKQLHAGKDEHTAEKHDGGTVETLEEIASNGATFTTFYADPPWQYDNQGTRASTDNHYPTMTVADICCLPVDKLAADKSLLFLWTTNGFLEAALTQVIPAWGFTFKSSMVWVKPQMGIGNYVRNAHEFLLIANRGGLIPAGKSQLSWIEADRTRHSAKPDSFRHVVESIAPGPRLEMFAREAMPGWYAWGNQVSKASLLQFAEGK